MSTNDAAAFLNGSDINDNILAEPKDPTIQNDTKNGDDPMVLGRQRNRSSNNDRVQEGDTVILQFGDGKLLFAQCNQSMEGGVNFRGKKIETTVKINRRSYSTFPMIGLPYGSVLEQGLTKLIPLPPGSKLIPEIPPDLLLLDRADNKNNDENDNDDTGVDGDDNNNIAANGDSENDQRRNENNSMRPTKKKKGNNDIESKKRDNRHLIDNNTAQTLDAVELQKLRLAGTEGSKMVDIIIQNSTTYEHKTDYSRAKYVARKQKKYQPRCRVLRTNSDTICQLLYMKDAKKIMNVRHDTLGQILSYANITAGQQVLVYETCMGLITCSLAQRMGGYGAILSIYNGQQHSYEDMMTKFNLTWSENYSIKWIHSSHVIAAEKVMDRNVDLMGTKTVPTIPIHADDIAMDETERSERNVLVWPCPLQDHTRTYLTTDPAMSTSNHHRKQFLLRRSTRFIRKMIRQTSLEIRKEYLVQRFCDSLIIVVKYDPVETLLQLFPYLSPSCPFVIYSEFIEPLTLCFRILQGIDDISSTDENNSSKQEQEQQQSSAGRMTQLPLAINLRLSDTWMREYQVLPGRTHPSMSMSQSGGFLLTGIKLDPIHGQNELDPVKLQQIKATLGGRRQRYGGVFNSKRNQTKLNDMKKRSKNDDNSNDDDDNANLNSGLNEPTPVVGTTAGIDEKTKKRPKLDTDAK